MHIRKEFESSGLVGLHPGDFQNNCGEAGHLGIFRLRHLFQTRHVPFGNVRLLHKPENFVRVPDDLSLGFWPEVAPLAYMNSVAFTRKLLVRPFSPANPAEVSHPGLLPATQKHSPFSRRPSGRSARCARIQSFALLSRELFSLASGWGSLATR